MHWSRLVAGLVGTMLSIATVPAAPPEPATPEAARGQPPGTVEPLPAELETRDRLLVQRLNQALNRNQLAEATRYAEQLLAVRRQRFPATRFPAGHPQLQECIETRGWVANLAGNYPRMLECYEQALEMCRSLRAADASASYTHKQIELLNACGVACYRLDRHAAALQHYAHGLALANTLDESSWQRVDLETLANLYSNQGAAFERLNKNQSAAKAYRQCDHTRQRLYPPAQYPLGHRSILRTRRLEGRALANSGQIREAIQLLEESVAACRRLREHAPELETDQLLRDLLVELGNTCIALGDTHRTRTALLEALELTAPQSRLDLTRVAILHGLLAAAIAEGDLPQMRQYTGQLQQMLAPLLASHLQPADARDVIVVLNHIAVALQKSGQFPEAEQHYLRCFQIWKTAAPPTNGELVSDTTIVNTMSRLATLYEDWGRYDKALQYQHAALTHAQSLFPPDQYPKGHATLVACLANLGTHCWLSGETDAALQYYRSALEMSEKLWPRSEYPEGTQVLVTVYSAYAEALRRMGNLGDAAKYFHCVHALSQVRFPKREYPKGHVDVEHSWICLGGVEHERGDYPLARSHFEKALSSCRRRMGDPSSIDDVRIACVWNCIGRSYLAEGRLADAEDYCTRSLQMRRRLFPPDSFPNGHPRIVTGLRTASELWFARQDFARALDTAREATEMECDLVEAFSWGASEAQLLNYASQYLQSVDYLVSSWRHGDRPAEDLYATVWRRRGLVMQQIADRHRLLRDNRDLLQSPDYREYLDTRRSLSTALLGTKSEDTNQGSPATDRIQALNRRREQLERQLVDQNGQEGAPLVTEHAPYQELLAALPADTTFVDFIRYDLHQQDPDIAGLEGHSQTATLGAFVLVPPDTVQFVDLGSAEPIDQLVTAWLADLQADRATQHGQRLRECIWAPLSDLLPPRISTIYLSPDGNLPRVPWSALPVDDTGQVVLHQFSVAVVPNGRFLLEQLRRSPPPWSPADRVLAVGNVDYGTLDSTATVNSPGIQSIVWQPLESTQTEIDALAAAAGSRSMCLLTGRQATVPQVLEQITQARCVHLATHGFFLDARLQAALGLYAPSPIVVGAQPASRSSVLARNPLLRSGIVLADANSPTADSSLTLPQPPAGILTGEDIVSLDCQNLELVVLSGCRTSLGDVVGGDSVYGLQVAFHLAGARNVVASLWDVDDRATARLMRHFYRQLWQEHQTPLEALRQAQLLMLAGYPEVVAAPRGPDLSGTVPRPKPGRAPGAGSRTSVWAAFTLSGPGS